jgi:enamine deaminase RidA (YjgF/YER057c/UK114 family)
VVTSGSHSQSKGTIPSDGQRERVHGVVRLRSEERRIDVAENLVELSMRRKIVQEPVAHSGSDELTIDIDEVDLLARQERGARHTVPLDVARQRTKIHRHVRVVGHEVSHNLLPRSHSGASMLAPSSTTSFAVAAPEVPAGVGRAFTKPLCSRDTVERPCRAAKTGVQIVPWRVTRGIMLRAMERRIINPWTWQDALGYVQANELTGAQRVLVCSGQTAVDANGQPQHAGDMAAQLNLALDNVETVLRAAGFTLGDVVRLNLYTTDVDALFEALPAVGPRIQAAGCRFSSTLLGVVRLASPELLIELEATAAG